jgi:hypothetical protein
MTVNKEQVKFALRSLLCGAGVALKTKLLAADLVKELREKSLVLLEKLETGKVGVDVAVVELNKLIESLNASVGAKEQLKYPPFVAKPTFVQVKNTIVTFEFFLNQKLRAREIPLEKEEVLFDECIELWKNVGLQLSPREGMMYLSRLIQRANDSMSQEKYPLPDDTQY